MLKRLFSLIIMNKKQDPITKIMWAIVHWHNNLPGFFQFVVVSFVCVLALFSLISISGDQGSEGKQSPTSICAEQSKNAVDTALQTDAWGSVQPERSEFAALQLALYQSCLEHENN